MCGARRLCRLERSLCVRADRLRVVVEGHCEHFRFRFRSARAARGSRPRHRRTVKSRLATGKHFVRHTSVDHNNATLLSTSFKAFSVSSVSSSCSMQRNATKVSLSVSSFTAFSAATRARSCSASVHSHIALRAVRRFLSLPSISRVAVSSSRLGLHHCARTHTPAQPSHSAVAISSFDFFFPSLHPGHGLRRVERAG